ncbi:MAG: LPP20 family lipoprotein [Paludibacteraceae bacterium]|nr:LPP20 family lipoprotein [Paludibacteraceae bacterium]
MKKIIIGLIGLVGAIGLIQAQEVDEIRSNPAYVWGQGFNESYQAADEEAVKDLISQIVVNVNSETETTISNEQSGEDVKSSVSTTGVLKISSTVSIPNCKRIVKDMGGSYFVLRYVEAAEIDKMFDARKKKIRDLVAAGERAENNNKIGDALRNYYWALKLISSIPEEHSSNLTTENGTMLFSVLKEHIGDVLDSCKIVADKRVPADEDRHELELQFTYKGRPIVSCDYKFYDGFEWNLAAVKDGIASVEVPADASQLRLRMEYIGERLWKSDPVVNDLLTGMPSVIPFPQFEKRITLTMLQEEKPQPAATAQKVLRDMKTDSMAVAALDKKEMQQQADIVAPLLKAIESRKYDDVKPLCTENGWKWFEKLVKYGNAKIIDRSELVASSFANGYLVRGVKAKFSFKRNNKSFVEDLVFYIKDGKIDGINFGLEQNALDDIMRHSMWEPQSRQVLVNFLENYKTAYALERLDYLDAVFSEDALIIIGNKIPEHKAADVVALNQERYEKCRMTKSQYIERLRKVFAKQEYVNIQFEDATVKKTNRDSERYQIIIKQHYYSTTYADKGYLFLLADISNPEKPVIHVRVWDEDKNALMDYAEWNF